MLSQELVGLRSTVERSPSDLEAWVALARLAARTGATELGLQPARHLAPLATAWRALPAESSLATLVLPLLGLRLPTPGGLHCWYWKKRALLEAGPAWNPTVGFPAVVERVADQVPMLLVPAGDPTGLPGHPVGWCYIDAVAMVEVAFVGFGRRHGLWVADRQDALDDMHWTQAMETVSRVKFDEAAAYAAWAGGRLPTMPEWTRAAEIHGGGEGAFGWLETGAPWAEWTAERIRSWPPARGVGEPEASFRVLLPLPP